MSVRIATAAELIDWLRLVDTSLSANEIRRVSVILTKLHLPSIYQIVQNVDPTQGTFWSSVDLVSRFLELRQ